jgi:hypothetical protein
MQTIKANLITLGGVNEVVLIVWICTFTFLLILYGLYRNSTQNSGTVLHHLILFSKH